MKEEWRDVVGAEKFYKVSSYGNIVNKLTGKRLKPSKSGSYNHIQLRYGVNKNYLVHRLVAEAFIPNPNNLPQVNHIDENKRNNRVDNLEWCSAKYNSTYGKGSKAKEHRVIQFDLSGNALKIWESIKEASMSLGITYQSISSCCRELDKSAGGYIWTYANLIDTHLRWKKK